MDNYFHLEIEEIELELEIDIIKLEIEISEFENEEIRTLSNPIQCNKCLKVFSAVSTLKLHIEINHIDNSTIELDEENVFFISNPIQCIICHKIFSNQGSYQVASSQARWCYFLQVFHVTYLYQVTLCFLSFLC